MAGASAVKDIHATLTSTSGVFLVRMMLRDPKAFDDLGAFMSQWADLQDGGGSGAVAFKTPSGSGNLSAGYLMALFPQEVWAEVTELDPDSQPPEDFGEDLNGWRHAAWVIPCGVTDLFFVARLPSLQSERCPGPEARCSVSSGSVSKAGR